MNDIKEKLDIIKKAILNAVNPKYIYLFGSYAYGNPTENSDIDIYVVIPDDFYEELSFMLQKISKYLCKYKYFDLDLLLVKESKYMEYKNISSFEKKICEKGILIYE